MMGYGWGMGWAGWLGMIGAFTMWVVLIALVVWAVTRVFPARSDGPQEKPLDILKRRFARGEITREQFEEMSKVLQDHQ